MNVLKSIDLFKQMAKEGGTTLDKAINMIEVYERHREVEQTDRRSTPHEKDILRDELAKLDHVTLRNSTAREIATELAQNGVAIRPGVQGVLSIISRTRRQLLLTHDQSKTVKAA